MRLTVRDLSARSREVFQVIIDGYIENGGPVGSRIISQQLIDETGGQDTRNGLSPASIRNIMADLEELGLIRSPHTSAGRVPTDLGFRFFVDGLMEVGELDGVISDAQRTIEEECKTGNINMTRLLERASGMVADLSRSAAVVAAPPGEAEIRHIEFVMLGPGRGLVILVSKSGMVENRLIELPPGTPFTHLTQATNYLNHVLSRAQLEGMSVKDIICHARSDMDNHQQELDDLTRKVVDAGLAVWSEGDEGGRLIVNGRANLLADGAQDIEQVRTLLSLLEDRKTVLRLLDATSHSGGVQIYIGRENPLFEASGCSLIVAPITRPTAKDIAGKKEAPHRVVGAIGVIGPTRVNYANVIPLVDYTSRMVSRLIHAEDYKEDILSKL